MLKFNFLFQYNFYGPMSSSIATKTQGVLLALESHLLLLLCQQLPRHITHPLVTRSML